jgi:glycosyltransferase involved in cell wall biosynthesis
MGTGFPDSCDGAGFPFDGLHGAFVSGTRRMIAAPGVNVTTECSRVCERAGCRMSFLDQVSVLVLTYNEAPNVGRTLDALTAFPEVVVLDSGSTDETLEIVARYPNARVLTHSFDNHAAQWNHGLTACGLVRPWVLALDADYVLPHMLVDEISGLKPSERVSGYRVSFRYCMFGRPLSGTLYPPAIALYRREKTRYVQQGHTQRAVVDGEIGELRGRIDHDDRKPLARWLVSQQKYAKLEADHLLGTPQSELRRTDRIRLLGWPAPLLILFYTLLVKRCVLDGLLGWLYVLQRTLAESLIAIEIVDRRLRGRQPTLTVDQGPDLIPSRLCFDRHPRPGSGSGAGSGGHPGQLGLSQYTSPGPFE